METYWILSKIADMWNFNMHVEKIFFSYKKYWLFKNLI